MSLAFSHDHILSGPAGTRRRIIRKTAVDLAFILAFVALAIGSILVVATHAPTPETAIAAFAEL